MILTRLDRQGRFTSWLLQGANIRHQWPFGVLRGATTCTSRYLSRGDDNSRIIWKVNNAILKSGLCRLSHVNSVKSVCTISIHRSSSFLLTQYLNRDRTDSRLIPTQHIQSRVGPEPKSRSPYKRQSNVTISRKSGLWRFRCSFGASGLKFSFSSKD